MPDSFDSGAIITTETLPQHLTFDELDVEREGLIENEPPIRYAKDKELLGGLKMELYNASLPTMQSQFEEIKGFLSTKRHAARETSLR